MSLFNLKKFVGTIFNQPEEQEEQDLIKLGDQLKNADAIRKDSAALVMSDEELIDTPSALLDNIVKITTDKKMQTELSQAIGRRAMPDAAAVMAQIILKAKKG